MRAPILVSTMLLSLLTTVVPAHAFDLTGHWVGKYSCKGFAKPFMEDGKLVNKYKTVSNPSELDINQNGATFGALINLGHGTFRYNAFAMPSVKSDLAGEVFFLGCSNANTPPSGSAGGAEILRAAVKTKDGTPKASFKGISIYVDDFPEVETCKYSYTRVSTTPAASIDICD